MKLVLLLIYILAFPLLAHALPSKPESNITVKLERDLPQYITILDVQFIIESKDVYPPGKTTELFFDYLYENDLIQNKVIADIGAACSPVGILATKYGAKEAVGVEINPEAVKCSNKNILNNELESNTKIIQGDGIAMLIPSYLNKVDIVVSSIPWDGVTSQEFDNIPNERKAISHAFYDVNDDLLNGIMQKGPSLLKKDGKIFITASNRVLSRIEELCNKNNMLFRIVSSQDIHDDGDSHNIIELSVK